MWDNCSMHVYVFINVCVYVDCKSACAYTPHTQNHRNIRRHTECIIQLFILVPCTHARMHTCTYANIHIHTHTVRREVEVLQAHEKISQTLRSIDIHALAPENVFHAAKQSQTVTERAMSQLEFYKWVTWPVCMQHDAYECMLRTH